METEFEISGIDDLNATLRFTMTVREWKNLRKKMFHVEYSDRMNRGCRPEKLELPPGLEKLGGQIKEMVDSMHKQLGRILNDKNNV